MAKLFEGAIKNWKFVLKFSFFSLLFFMAEFFYQFYILIPGELNGSLVRSFALSGATFIGCALIISSIMRWKPELGIHWGTRRAFGVIGSIFILFHVLSVLTFFFNWEISNIFWSLNPIENPLLFGVLALPVFMLMALTSNDVAYVKLGKNWKTLHRFVYFGYLFAIFHFLLINPELLNNLAGYLLLGVTFLALSGELYWFLKHSFKVSFSGLGTKIGFFVILLYLFIGYFAFFAPAAMEQQKTIDNSIEKAVAEMKEFMEKEGGDPDVLTTVVEADQDFSGEMMQSSSFEPINYMTSGSVQIEQRDGIFFVVFQDNFETPNGPDLVVYLTRNSEPTKRDDISNGIKLGELKSTVGKQVYEIPSELNINDFKSVSIHCRAFNVPWSYARLK